jgi:DNA mismatch repair protein MutS2
LNETALRTLEFDRIRALLLTLAGSVEGRDRLANLAPKTDPVLVQEELGATVEALALLTRLGRQPYHDLPDLSAILPAARVSGLHLEPGALTDVASFIEGGVEIAGHVARAEGAPRLSRRASQVRDLTAVAVAIRRAILPSGEVADDASPKLAETRRALTRLRAQLQSVMESFLRGKDAERLLQDKLVTTRNDRYVLILKAEHRGQIPGIIHGSSGSGASLFVEPMPAVELNNDIVALGDEERREVIRILRELTARVGEVADDLALAVSVLGELDALQAKAVLAREMDATAPEIVPGLDLELWDARHPLLMGGLTERLGLPRRSSREPVPVSLRAGGGEPVLVISGPNTGGKTVALKTVGLLALMAQSGLLIPAGAGSRLPVFRRVFADIGDDQSIAADLSTFSAHLKTIVEMTRDLEHPALVLLDEVGAGTDPTEGGALGVAIVEHFRRAGAMVVTTTHHGLMKAYAQSTPGVVCASFGYDPQSYEPTYRLALGVPGRSLALEMAERLGLPASVVADARARREQKEAQAEALLQSLEQEKAGLEREAEALATERRALQQEADGLHVRERELESRKRAELDAFKRELQRRGEETARRAAEAIQEAVRRIEAGRRASAPAAERARSQALASIREAQREALDTTSLGLSADPEPIAAELAVGVRVRVTELGVVGEILALGEHGEAEVAVAGKRLRVPRASLVAVAGSQPRAAQASAARAPRGGAAQLLREHAAGRGSAADFATINLVGLTVDEALPRVDKLLDDAALADRRQVRVIHGFGAGTLRRAVAGLLDGHPHVAAFRPAAANEGGGGVTIVELKE